MRYENKTKEQLVEEINKLKRELEASRGEGPGSIEGGEVEYEKLQRIVYEIAKKTTNSDNLDELLRAIKTLLSEALDTTNFFVAFYDRVKDELLLPYFEDAKDKFYAAAAKGTLTYYMISKNTPLLLTLEEMESMSNEGLIDVVGTPSKVWLGCPINLGGGDKGAIVLQDYEKKDTFTKKHLEILKFVSGQIELAIQRKRYEEEMRRLISELHLSNKTMEEDAKTLMELNQKLTESERELKILNETKDKFFSIISHDLKNPFNVMVTLTKYLSDNFDQIDREDLKNGLIDIKNSVNRSFELLTNLLDWARSQTGKIKFSPKDVSIYELIISSIYLLKINADKKNIKLKMDVHTDLHIMADYNMLETIIRNLISNAIKFTKEGGTVTVKAIKQHQNTQIIVKDTGVGISKEDIEKLFRIDVSHTTVGTGEEKGTGLGLILCKEFAEKHGGTVSVTSQVGKGSTFIITIPN